MQPQHRDPKLGPGMLQEADNPPGLLQPTPVRGWWAKWQENRVEDAQKPQVS